MNFIKSLLLALEVIGKLADYFERKQISEEAVRAWTAALLQNFERDVERAKDARANLNASVSDNPGGLRDDDGHKRAGG